MDALDSFAAYQRSRNLAETTIQNRRSILRTLAASTGRDLLDLTLDDLRRHIGRRGIAPASRRTEHNAICAFYAWAMHDHLIDTNPTTLLDAPKVPRTEPRPFTFEQVTSMLISGAYFRTRAMILIGYYQGFRVSQIAAVHGHDIDLESMTIRTIGKGGVEGLLPLHPVIAELAHVMPTDGWWFPARNGRRGHIQPGAVTDLIADAKRRAGILDPRLTAHSLRHSFGTELVDRGVDIRVVQELMMHASLSSTQIYTGVSRRRKQEAIAVLPMRDIPTHSGRRAA